MLAARSFSRFSNPTGGGDVKLVGAGAGVGGVKVVRVERAVFLTAEAEAELAKLPSEKASIVSLSRVP